MRVNDPASKSQYAEGDEKDDFEDVEDGRKAQLPGCRVREGRCEDQSQTTCRDRYCELHHGQHMSLGYKDVLYAPRWA